MFISDKFTYKGIHCDEKGVILISMNSNVLNKYGLDYTSNISVTKQTKDGSFNIQDNEEEIEDIVLQFALVDEKCNPVMWDRENTSDIYEWLTSDNFAPFVSEDDEEVAYFFRTKKITRNFTPNKYGYLEVVFQPYSNYVYKMFTKKVACENEIEVTVMNESDTNDFYHPIIEIENLEDNLNIISIENKTLEDDAFVISDLEPSEKVVIDSLIGTVINDYDENRLSKCNRRWVKLKKGRNILKICGKSNVIIKCQFPLKV